MAIEPTIPLWVDLTAVGVGALQGALFATEDNERNEFDLFAPFVFAVLVGLGGGIIRDVLLNETPVALSNEWYLVVALLAGGGGLLFGHMFQRIGPFVDYLDAAVVGLFVVVGALKANAFGLGPVAQVLLGTITGVGGAVLRDIVARQPVRAVQRDTPYAIVAVVGSIVLVALLQLGVDEFASGAASILAVVAFRITALRRGWRTTGPSAVAVSARLGRTRNRFGDRH